LYSHCKGLNFVVYEWSINKRFVAVAMSILFAILSTVIILTAFVALRKKK